LNAVWKAVTPSCGWSFVPFGQAPKPGADCCLKHRHRLERQSVKPYLPSVGDTCYDVEVGPDGAITLPDV
jgi:hypothetical protein